jgi:3-oxoacyl-[acyl-carrier-protein] synthase II
VSASCAEAGGGAQGGAAGDGETARGGRQPAAVAVTGAGVVCPLGDRPWKVFAALCRGETALAPVEGFDLTAPDAGGLSAGSVPDLAAEMRGFDPQDYLGRRNFRPLDRTGRLATVAAELALTASGWSEEARRDAEVGLVLGTMFGSVHTISAFDRRAQTAGPIYAKPMDFANSVINAAAGQTAIWHDLRGVNTTLSGGNTGGLAALGYAADLVAGGRAGSVLAGGADELCFESFYGFARAGWLAGSGGTDGAETPHPVPFHPRRNGFVPGEGAALLMLESEAAARRRGVPVLARVRGHGSAFDPSRGEDDTAAVAALERAVHLALEGAGIKAGDVGLLSLSGNGSRGGDAREARALERVFGDGLGDVPALAVKGALGEALGASGALQALMAVLAMTEGRLPGVTGLDAADPELPALSLAAQERPTRAVTALVTALDFDGNAVAVVLGAGDAARRET